MPPSVMKKSSILWTATVRVPINVTQMPAKATIHAMIAWFHPLVHHRHHGYGHSKAAPKQAGHIGQPAMAVPRAQRQVDDGGATKDAGSPEIWKQGDEQQHIQQRIVPGQLPAERAAGRIPQRMQNGGSITP